MASSLAFSSLDSLNSGAMDLQRLLADLQRQQGFQAGEQQAGGSATAQAPEPAAKRARLGACSGGPGNPGEVMGMLEAGGELGGASEQGCGL